MAAMTAALGKMEKEAESSKASTFAGHMLGFMKQYLLKE